MPYLSFCYYKEGVSFFSFPNNVISLVIVLLLGGKWETILSNESLKGYYAEFLTHVDVPLTFNLLYPSCLHAKRIKSYRCPRKKNPSYDYISSLYLQRLLANAALRNTDIWLDSCAGDLMSSSLTFCSACGPRNMNGLHIHITNR